jgi:hypothetical protein
MIVAGLLVVLPIALILVFIALIVILSLEHDWTVRVVTFIGTFVWQLDQKWPSLTTDLAVTNLPAAARSHDHDIVCDEACYHEKGVDHRRV